MGYMGYIIDIICIYIYDIWIMIYTITVYIYG